MLEKIYEICNARANKICEKEFLKRNPAAKNPNFWEIMDKEAEEHPGVPLYYDIGADEEYSIWLNELEKYIKNKEYGYTVLIKDLRKDGFKVTRTGTILPI